MRTKSCRHDAISMPSAENVPGTFGTITFGMKISRAIAHRVQRAGAAEGDHRGLARIDALVDRDRAHRERHRGVGDLHDAERRLRHAEPQRVGDLLPRSRASAAARSSRIAPLRKRSAIDAAEHEVGVGDDRIGRALAVAGRAGIGAGALRPDVKAAGRVAPGDRAAAGADLDDVDDRQLHRLAAAPRRR